MITADVFGASKPVVKTPKLLRTIGSLLLSSLKSRNAACLLSGEVSLVIDSDEIPWVFSKAASKLELNTLGEKIIVLL